MKNYISNRIALIMKEYGYNKNSFSKAIGLKNNVTIGRIINENRHPSYEVLYKIIQTFGSIDANWLLTGKGNMYKNNYEDINNAAESNSNYNTRNEYQEIIQILREQLSIKDKEIERLMNFLEDKKERPTG